VAIPVFLSVFPNVTYAVFTVIPNMPSVRENQWLSVP